MIGFDSNQNSSLNENSTVEDLMRMLWVFSHVYSEKYTNTSVYHTSEKQMDDTGVVHCNFAVEAYNEFAYLRKHVLCLSFSLDAIIGRNMLRVVLQRDYQIQQIYWNTRDFHFDDKTQSIKSDHQYVNITPVSSNPNLVHCIPVMQSFECFDLHNTQKNRQCIARMPNKPLTKEFVEYWNTHMASLHQRMMQVVISTSDKNQKWTLSYRMFEQILQENKNDLMNRKQKIKKPSQVGFSSGSELESESENFKNFLLLPSNNEGDYALLRLQIEEIERNNNPQNINVNEDDNETKEELIKQHNNNNQSLNSTSVTDATVSVNSNNNNNTISQSTSKSSSFGFGFSRSLFGKKNNLQPTEQGEPKIVIDLRNMLNKICTNQDFNILATDKAKKKRKEVYTQFETFMKNQKISPEEFEQISTCLKQYDVIQKPIGAHISTHSNTYHLCVDSARKCIDPTKSTIYNV